MQYGGTGCNSLPRSPFAANELRILAPLMAASGESKAQILHRVQTGELPQDRDLLLSPKDVRNVKAQVRRGCGAGL
jgi:hypothetical protein